MYNFLLICRAYEKCKYEIQKTMRNCNKREMTMPYSMERLEGYFNEQVLSERAVNGSLGKA